jgi:glycosyltransferase involved in cell wall biosynthesis
VAHAPRLLLVAPPTTAGIASHVIFLLGGLRKADYAVRVVCEQGGRIAQAAGALGVPVHGMMCVARGGPVRAMTRAVRLARVIAQFRPHIVHTHAYAATAIGSAACAIARFTAGGQARRSSLVITLHNYPPSAQGDSVRPSGGAGRRAFDMAVGRAKHIITVSEDLRRSLVAAYPEAIARSTTIHNGVETRQPPARDPAEVRRELGLPPVRPGSGQAGVSLVGVVARLAPEKGIMEFIRSARLVADAHPAVAFALCGDGPMRAEAAALRRELGLEGQLSLLGHIEEVRDFIASLDLLVVPSRSEGSPVVAMEAMALGKPVVATAVGGVPEVVPGGETGVLVQAGDAQALADGILELLRDPARAQEMGERGRQRAAREFDVNDMVEKTKAVYADVMRDDLRAGGAGR